MMTPQRRRLMKMKIQRWIIAVNNREMVKVRDLAKLLGQLNFLRFQIQYASLISNSLNHLRTQAVKNSGWICSVLPNRRVLGNLYLWMNKIKQNKPLQLEDLKIQALLTTDAALEGWGSTLQVQQTEMMEAGKQQKNWHLRNSNQRETQAVLMTPSMHNQLIEQNQIHSLTLYSDNQIVLLEEINIRLAPIHIPGFQNNKADALSRLMWRGDYMIKPEILQQTMEQLQFFHQLDTFATRAIRQCNRYCSIQKDRRAEGKRGAFNMNWTNEALLLHPPIELIPRVLQKMKLDLSVALFLLQSRCFEKYKQLLSPILQIINFGPTGLVLKKGNPWECHQLKLPPGDQLDELTTSIPLLNNYSETQLQKQDQYQQQFNI
ncbi:MAG: hypothetical protein EZS28_044492 [Streblomastix strix]|uniref:Uncharacterized protein n=1 Tax=Streblomastix strix TaxID=222440 RepID=A0A5J4TR81_9EUKA|nr:MAG: hypothetical protein EZS28_044492 [Streblomastix strix]